MKEYIIYPNTPKAAAFYAQLCGVTYPDIHYHVRRNKSPVFVIEYIMEGSGYVFQNGERHAVSKGDVYFLKIGENHEYYPDSENPWKKIWLNASGTVIDSLLSAYSLDSMVVVRNVPAMPYFREIMKINSDANIPPTKKNQKTAVVFHQLIQLLSDCVNSENTDKNTDAELIREYIEQNCSESFSLSDLSALIYKSESQTIRIFKNAFSVSPYSYMLDCRIKKACMILRNTSISIKEAAYTVGFSDEHYFCRVFKKKKGISPSAYRAKASSPSL